MNLRAPSLGLLPYSCGRLPAATPRIPPHISGATTAVRHGKQRHKQNGVPLPPQVSSGRQIGNDRDRTIAGHPLRVSAAAPGGCALAAAAFSIRT